MPEKNNSLKDYQDGFDAAEKLYVESKESDSKSIAAANARIAELEKSLETLVNFCLEHPAVYDGASPIKNAIKLLKGNQS